MSLKVKNQSKLQKILDRYGITAKELAQLMREDGIMPVGRDRLSRFMAGKQELYTGSIIRICKILGCTPNDIIDYEQKLKK